MSAGLSERKDPAEFVLARKQWMTSRPPVGDRDLGLWQLDCKEVFEQLPYAENVRVQRGESSAAMVDVQATLNLPVEDWQYVRADCEKVWNEDLAVGLRAFHSCQLQQTTLIFSFICLNGMGEYVTGQFRAKLIR